MAEENGCQNNENKIQSGSNKKLVLVITCTALLLDDLLSLGIIPILPVYERQLKENDRSNGDNSTHTDVRIGMLISSKSLTQLLVGPIIGTLIDKIGYEIPLMAGCGIIAVSTTAFAFTTIYPLLLAARCIQGIGTMLTDIAAFSLIADRYTENAERSKAQGIALAFMTFGSLFAPAFGGFFFEYVHKTVPFLILAVLSIVDGILVFFIYLPKTEKNVDILSREKQITATPIYKLILDPYIAIGTGSFFTVALSWGFLIPTLSRWLTDTMQTDEFQSGLVWLPGFFFHLAGVYATVLLSKYFPNYRWLYAGAGLFIEGISCLAIPFCRYFYLVSIPLAFNCFGIALVHTAITPMLACIIDSRHARVYGSVYSLIGMSYGLAYTVGPIIGDILYQQKGFLWMNVALCLSNILYVPLLFVLRNFQPNNSRYTYIPESN